MSAVEKEELYLTTFDNPFDPITQNDEWYNFDVGKGYCTCSYVERIVQSNNPNKTTIDVDDNEFDKAMIEIASMFPNMYKIVRRTVEVDSVDLID